MNTSATSSIKLYRSSDWHRLTGRFVEVRLDNQLHRQGFVETVMPDGSGIWLAADAAQSRQYIHKSEGYVLWADDFHFNTAT
jgi:hypothetical protein